VDEVGILDDIPWPRASDSLLGARDDWQAIACLDWARGDAVVRALGFQRAAEVLFQELARGRDQDLLVYPFAFCWRHHLELELKCLMRAAAGSLGRSLSKAAQDDMARYGLKQLWARCRPLLEEVDPRSTADLGHAERLLLELHEVDPSGEAFRYATTNAGDPTLAEISASRIALDRFHHVCQALSNLFGGCAAQIDDWRSATGR